MNLTARQIELLRLVVEGYVTTGRPVSSGTLAQCQRDRPMSPATIRTELGRLTLLGLLEQPHPRAGRVPTEEGLRSYLNDGMNQRLHPWDKTRLDAAARETSAPDFPAVLGHCLAELSGEMAVLGVPRFVGSTFREVGLVRAQPGCFIAIFVSPGGQVQQRMVQVDFDLNPDELQRIQNYLNDRLTNRTLSEVRACIELELVAEEVRRDRLRRAALEIGLRALPEPEIELVIDGAARLAAKPEFADLERLHAVLEAIETKTILLDLLDRIIDAPDVTIVLGSEHRVSEVSDLACVGGSCATTDASHPATITLVGPTRMDYERLVPLVRYAKVLLERHWLPR